MYFFSARKLKERRERCGLSRPKLAVATDLSVTSLTMYEVGTRQPCLDNLAKLATALDCTPNDLFTTRADRR